MCDPNMETRDRYSTREVVTMLRTTEGRLRYVLRDPSYPRPNTLSGGDYDWSRADVVAMRDKLGLSVRLPWEKK